jgi:hypothetical protein
MLASCFQPGAGSLPRLKQGAASIVSLVIEPHGAHHAGRLKPKAQ